MRNLLLTSAETDEATGVRFSLSARTLVQGHRQVECSNVPDPLSIEMTLWICREGQRRLKRAIDDSYALDPNLGRPDLIEYRVVPCDKKLIVLAFPMYFLHRAPVGGYVINGKNEVGLSPLTVKLGAYSFIAWRCAEWEI